MGKTMQVANPMWYSDTFVFRGHKDFGTVYTFKKGGVTMMANEQKASAWDKASELAAAATKTDRATYEEVRQACIDAIKWQAEQDKLELDAKDESIIQMEMTVFERVQSVCRYRCARFGDTYKCANGKSFGETCSKQNCPIIK